MDPPLRKVKLLGQGAFGKCYLMENTVDGSFRVVKQISIACMSPQEKNEAYNEARLMQAFDHPNIIKCYDIYTTTNGKLCIVMEYADGGDLHAKIRAQKPRHFSERQVLDWFVQICLALKHVHDRKVLHRDIKAQNVFLTAAGTVKLGDFGISKVLASTMDKARTVVGTPYYLSPEIVESKPYNYKSDVWSLGVLLYEMCTLKPPFDASSLHFLALKIVRGAYPPLPSQFTRDLKVLVGQMLSTDNGKRPTIAQILRLPFIKDRIQTLLSESVRNIEFSHTVLHNQDVFNKPSEAPKKKAPSEEVKQTAKPKKVATKKKSKKAPILHPPDPPSKEEKKRERDEERAKMAQDIRRKAREQARKGKRDVGVEWIGMPEQERIIHTLQEACEEEDSTVDSWQAPPQAVAVDREDLLADEDDDEEEKEEENQEFSIALPATQEPAEHSTHSRLENIREYLERHLGTDVFLAAYRGLREILSEQAEDWDYSVCAAKLQNVLVTAAQKQLLPTIHMLIFLEDQEV